jgi:hypothetical protein
MTPRVIRELTVFALLVTASILLLLFGPRLHRRTQ